MIQHSGLWITHWKCLWVLYKNAGWETERGTRRKNNDKELWRRYLCDERKIWGDWWIKSICHYWNCFNAYSVQWKIYITWSLSSGIGFVATVAYFALGSLTITMLFFCVAAMVYTLGCKVGGGGTGQSSRQIPRWYLLRDLPVSHGNLSCAWKTTFCSFAWKGSTCVYLHSGCGHLRLGCVLGMCQVVLK